MKEKSFLSCPSISEEEKRIEEMKKIIETWIYSDGLLKLISIFNENAPINLPLKEYINWLESFSENWDFRKKQNKAKTCDTKESARWLITDDLLSEEQKELTLEVAKNLGLDIPALDNYDYICVLGGARLSCLLRPKFAAHLISNHLVNSKKIILLSSMRPVAETEREATNTYAINAKTEYDLMNSGAEISFSFNSVYKEECFRDTSNPNNDWAIREYVSCFNDTKVISLAAPSSLPNERRANSLDTYNFFVDRYNVFPGSKILLITSQIYVPYQQLEAIRGIAFPRNLIVETVGYPSEWNGSLTGMLQASNYLQEIRSTIQSINRFSKKYF